MTPKSVPARTMILFSLVVVMAFLTTARGFTPVVSRTVVPMTTTSPYSVSRWMAAEDEKNSGVVELGGGDDDDSETTTDKKDLPKAVSAPLFISQGEIDPGTLNPDFSDAKQTRVIIYTILSLLPVLFLIPFMLGRDFIPVDSLPPVDLSN